MDAVYGCGPEHRKGILSGSERGWSVPRRKGKIAIVESDASTNGHDLEQCYGYGNTMADSWFMRITGHPVAINPKAPFGNLQSKKIGRRTIGKCSMQSGSTGFERRAAPPRFEHGVAGSASRRDINTIGPCRRSTNRLDISATGCFLQSLNTRLHHAASCGSIMAVQLARRVDFPMIDSAQIAYFPRIYDLAHRFFEN